MHFPTTGSLLALVPISRLMRSIMKNILVLFFAFVGTTLAAECYPGCTCTSWNNSYSFNSFSCSGMDLHNNGTEYKLLTSISRDFVDNIPRKDIYWFTVIFENISDIEKGSFTNISPNIRRVSLAYNKLKHLRRGMFIGLEPAEFLDLSNNVIDTIEIGTFENLKSLTELKLGQNKLKTIKNGHFRGLSALLSLSLALNEIDSLDPLAFAEIAQLQTLALTKTKLKHLKGELSNSLKNLQDFDFSYNNLVSLTQGTIPHFPKLKVLVLSNCNISKIEIGAFASVPNLTTLYLRNNSLTNDVDVIPSPFRSLSNLEAIYLDGNKFTGFPKNVFNALPNIAVLDLSVNNITTLDFDFSVLKKLNAINIRQNPLKCDCNLKKSIMPYRNTILVSVFCEDPLGKQRIYEMWNILERIKCN